MKATDDNDSDRLLNRIESVSGEIQLLALNIAVAAAKIAHKQDLGLEVNQGLSQLVNQATQAVKQMNLVLTAAGRGEKGKMGDDVENSVDSELLFGIEKAMESIIADSEKIARILNGIKGGNPK